VKLTDSLPMAVKRILEEPLVCGEKKKRNRTRGKTNVGTKSGTFWVWDQLVGPAKGDKTNRSLILKRQLKSG